MTDNNYLIEDTRLINISSSSATSLVNGALKSDLVFDFKNILTDEDNITHTTIGITEAQIPSSFYTVNEYNNVLMTSIGTITITKGNYNSRTLITELTARFLALSSVMVIAISKITGKFTFTATGSTTFYFSGSSAFEILGFDSLTNYSSINNVIVAPFLLNLLGIQQIRIHSSAFSCYNSSSTNMGENNLVGVIQNTSPPFGMILYRNSQTSHSVLKNKQISLIDIQLLDEKNRYLDFNNTDFTITFMMTIFRRIKSSKTLISILKPILQTIETDLEKIPDKSVPKPESPKPEPDTTDNTTTDNVMTDDSNSLDMLEYNNLI